MTTWRKYIRLLMSALFLLVLFCVLNMNVQYAYIGVLSSSSSSSPSSSNVKQDDPIISIDLIKKEYLIPPAPPNSRLNLTASIWQSPLSKVVMQVLGNKTKGFFIECGAFDGEFLSNTIELEEYFNWSGVLIEADPTYHKKLFTKNRKAWIAPVCLSPTLYPMKITMQRHKDTPSLSNIPEDFGETKAGEFPFKFSVQCLPLHSILEALNQTVIDYLSLDVERAEWRIIQTIPFSKLTIKVISVERSRDYEKCKNYLQSLGYVEYAKITDPKLYVHDGIFVLQKVL